MTSSTQTLAKGQLTLDYDPWIKKITRKMWHKFGQHYEYEELLGVAYIASLEAEKGYDSKMAKFSAYVKPRVEGAIIRSVSSTSNIQHKILSKIYAFMDKYVLLHDRMPSQKLIIEHLQISEEDFMDAIDSTTRISIVSTDDVYEDDLAIDINLDTLAEFDKVSDIVGTLSKKQQRRIADFMSDPEASSGEIQEILDIIRTRLNIKV